MSMASSTMSMAATATASATHDMSDMDMSSSSNSGMHMMMSMGTFHWTSSGDGIWFDSWVPASEGAYIGACFGLFFFSILSRGLPALEAYFMRWRTMRDNKIESNVLTSQPVIRKDIEKSHNTDDLSSQSFNPNSYPNPLKVPTVPPFSWSTDTIRSFISTLTSFVSYLLMMVVMTGNGGFFLVIMIGVFFGEMAFGRFKSMGGFPDDHSH
ncbi:Ctr copper transporter family-domain-containing protein [Mucor mucedo]|uniref:Ctr copper transporter family-domain-containing protein n=1 Tax=Mucor mucedo TaxID=29922 RepID=UPI00221E78B5|nr:Ctr copper transporter family-domain-containing protein [Mucor mucedo]KAI7888184.1 Ctr copper transporter family-domain-containing protein [Mucor mucedo]